jgi:hypothetical protein
MRGYVLSGSAVAKAASTAARDFATAVGSCGWESISNSNSIGWSGYNPMASFTIYPSKAPTTTEVTQGWANSNDVTLGYISTPTVNLAVRVHVYMHQSIETYLDLSNSLLLLQ